MGILVTAGRWIRRPLCRHPLPGREAEVRSGGQICSLAFGAKPAGENGKS